MDAGSEYEKTLAEEVAKLQRLYGGGDLTSFPEFTFPGEASGFSCLSRQELIISNSGITSVTQILVPDPLDSRTCPIVSLQNISESVAWNIY